jgi:hypothetical protein
MPAVGVPPRPPGPPPSLAAGGDPPGYAATFSLTTLEDPPACMVTP